MDTAALIMISVGLAADAFAVSVSNGSVDSKSGTYGRYIVSSALFGFFQAFMPILGWLLCRLGQYFTSGFEDFLAFALLMFIGGKMIYDAILDMRAAVEAQKPNKSLKITLLLALATSVDAFASGAALPAAVNADTFLKLLCSVICIGCVTFVLSCFGHAMGKKLGERFSYRAEIFGGCILILLALRILIFS